MKHDNVVDRPDLVSAQPVGVGELKATSGWQTATFAKPTAGRYVAIECGSTHDGKPVAVAELYLFRHFLSLASCRLAASVLI